MRYTLALGPALGANFILVINWRKFLSFCYIEVFIVLLIRMLHKPEYKKMAVHHQPINVSTAGAQAFLMDYT
jgi:hypothetical protein